MIFSFLFCKSVFFPYGHPTESWYIEIAEHIVCVHYRIIFRMRTRAQWMLESRKRANSGMLSILGIGKFRGFLLHERYLSPVEVFFPLHFFVHILLFDRCIYCRCTVPDLRWCKWSIFTNSRRLIWQSWTNMKKLFDFAVVFPKIFQKFLRSLFWKVK